MADETGSGVDPRFNPAFQRGFDPSVPIEEYVPASAPAAGTPTVAAPTAAPTQAVPTDADAASEAESLLRTNASATDTDSPASEVPAARNPFFVALLVVALLLIGAGTWLFVSTENQFDSSQVQSQGDYVSLTSLIEFAPFLALVGGVIIIGLLFIVGLRYGGRS
jgi:hypothetical protein